MTTMTTVRERTPYTYLDEPPAYELKDISVSDRKELIDEVRSVGSSDTEATAVPSAAFTPSKSLLIAARGIRLIRLPLPSRQLEIQITTTSGEIAYVSSRAKACSGNAVLSNAYGKDLLASEYLFGPGRDPKIHLLNEGADETATITTKGKWTSRRQDFVLPDGATFAWRYKRERDVFASAGGKDKNRTHLILEVSEGASAAATNSKKKDNALLRRVAELVRNEEARTPGTSSSDAGNGGELKIDSEYCESIGLREDVVVASCLMMLKKEIDRRRAIQFAVMVSITSGH